MSSTIESIKAKLYTKNEYGVEYQDPEAKLSEEDVSFLNKKYGISSELHSTCIKCQARQILKYPDPKDGDGKRLAKFAVPCKGIANSLPPGSNEILNKMVAKGLDPERAKLVLRATQDPVAWCELMFGFNDKTKGQEDEFYLKPYQKEQLRCNSRRIVIREGRRAGKALAIDTPIPTPDGWTTMEKLKEGDRVFDHQGNPCNVVSVTEIMYGRKCYKVKFSDGASLVADAEHQWGVKTSRSIRDGRRNGNEGFLVKTTEQMIGDLSDGIEWKYRIPLVVNIAYPKRDVSYDPYILGWMVARGEWKRLSGILLEERIPEAYLVNESSVRLNVIRGICDSVGEVHKNEYISIKVPTNITKDVISLLLSFGFHYKAIESSNLTEIRFKAPREVFCRSNLNKGFQKKLNMSLDPNRYIVAIEPIESVPVKCIMVDSKEHLYLAGREYIATHNTFAVALKLIHYAFNLKIPKGTSDGVPVYTGPEIMVVTPYSSQVNSVFREIEKLLKRCPELSSEVTSGTGGSLYTKTPFLRMELKNGGTISGFISGVGKREDGSAGGTIRGQNADIVYIDEMDMIPDAVLESVILPLLATRKGAIFIASSTPIGKRGSFYRWCKEDPTFKEDHLPTTVLPHWAEIKDLLISKGMSKEAVYSEYMAQFIESSYGVFKPSYVYSSRVEYDYSRTSEAEYLKKIFKISRPERLNICIGIDWNKNAGSEFAVVGYDPDVHRWIVLETVNVPQSEFKAVRWKEEVIRLNYKWKPNFIYADEGYGDTIIEDLRVLAHRFRSGGAKTLQQAETAKLVDRLKAFNFSSMIEMRSPLDNTVFTKYGKDFLVENTIRILEDNALVFSADDEPLKEQFLNYIIIRRNSATGRPVYGPDNSNIGDHRLDAVMLALGGLHMELSEYSKEYRAHSSPKFWEKDQLDMRTEARIAKEEDRKPMSALDALLKRGAKLVGDDNLVIRGDLAPGEKAPEYMEGRGSPIGERGKTDKKSKSEVWEHYKKMLPVKPSNSMFSTDREHTVQDPFDSVKVGKRRGERHTPNRRRR